jgi:hypothetical protein
MTKPHVGQIAHYQSHGSPDGTYKSECRAAIITAVPAKSTRARAVTTVDLYVMTTTGSHHNISKLDEETKAGGTWHTPCDVVAAAASA